MLPLLLLLLATAPTSGLAWSLSSPSPRFAVVSADRAREGKGQYRGHMLQGSPG
jgi:hypothetical protein